MTGKRKWTPGPWRWRLYANSDEDVAAARKVGIVPVRMLTNEGQVAIMAGSDDDTVRVALVDSQTRFKRGEGYRVTCEERDASANLLSAAPDLYEALEATTRMLEAAHRQLGMYSPDNERFVTARAALAKARGEAP